MDQEKITHNLQAIFYLAGMKTFVGLKFINGEAQIDWEDLELFWQDKPLPLPYWESITSTLHSIRKGQPRTIIHRTEMLTRQH